MKFHTKKAFTLVEMLIVIVIIGILAAALIPKLTGIQSRARDVARKTHLQQLSTALATYNLDEGVYPVGNKGGINTTSANATSITAQTSFKYITTSTPFSNATPAADSDASTDGGARVQDVLGNLVFNGILKELFVETNTASRPYTYAVYNAGKVFSLMALSEGAGKNANFNTVHAMTSADEVTNPGQFTNKLCTEVSSASSNPTANVTLVATEATTLSPTDDCKAKPGDAIYAIVN